MFRRLLAAVTMLVAVCFAVPALAVAPTLTGLPFTANGTTYNECTTTVGGLFYVCHVDYGINPLTGLPAPMSVDAAGELSVANAVEHQDLLNLLGALPQAGLPNLTNQAAQVSAEQASAAALGTPADAAYAGSGNAGVVGLLKGLWTKLSGTLTVGGAVSSNCQVVSADQAFTAGASQSCTMTPTGRVKVGLSSAGTNGASAPAMSDQVGGVDPSGNLQALQLDALKNLKVTLVSFPAQALLSNVSAATTGTAISGIPKDSYLFACVATTWNSATVQLQFLGPDGATWLNFTSVALSANGVIGVGIGQSASVRAVSTGSPISLSCNLS